jgi:hypothetical protein
MTSLPAQTFGFRDRGLIREGFAADLVIFDENTIIDQATFDKPHQYPLGISYVIVNGAPVIENNQMTAVRSGVALRGSGFLGEPLRISAYLCGLCVEIGLNAENAKIRREPQRKLIGSACGRRRVCMLRGSTRTL